MLAADATQHGMVEAGAAPFAAALWTRLSPGSRLGPYEIVSLLGTGGMAEVYVARDPRLDREVAVKVLPAERAGSEELRRRFEREARAVAALQHPHICTLFDVGREGNVDYLVMELLAGESLAERLSRGPLPLEQVLRRGAEIAAALDYAHRRGIVHRDLKPGNVMLTKAGAKLLDFGLARMHAADPRELQRPVLEPMAASERPFTAEGTILGTLCYMAPEQLEGGQADARTDIFALGAVLHEMATGRKAFAGKSQASLIAAIMAAEPPAISSLQRLSPPALDRLVATCLAKDPDARWQSAHDIASELAWIAAGDETSAVGSPIAAGLWRRRAGWAATVALASLVALLAMLLAFWNGRRTALPARPAVRFEVPPPPGSGFEGGIALSRDGAQLAFVAPGPQGEDVLWVRALAALVPHALAGTEGASYPFWSPDGGRLAFFAKGKLRTVAVAGGQVQTLCAAANPRGGAWSDRGVLLMSVDAGARITRVAAAGGEPVTLPGVADTSGDGLVRFPELLPDGHRFLYFRLAGDSSSGVWIGDLDSAERRLLLRSDSTAVYAAPGFLVFRRGERLLAQRFDARTLRLEGEPATLAEDVWWNGTGTLLTPVSASANGVLAFRTGGPERSQLVWVDRQGHPSATLGPPGAYIEPSISPDGRRVAVTRAAEENSSVDIWLLDAERGGLARFTSGPWYSATPTWSPDGRQIVYAAFPSPQVMRRDASGMGREEVLWKSERFSPVTDWSRDGSALLLAEIDFRTFGSDITRVSLVGERRVEPLIAGDASEGGARLSPDGGWLAYESDESGIPEVIVRSYPDLRERWPISTGGGTQPRWRGDGRELYFVAPDRRLMAVEIRTAPQFVPQLPRALFATHILPLVEARNQYDVTADGERFLVNSRRPEDATQPIVVLVDWTPGLGGG